jgi:hypothetical protein
VVVVQVTVDLVEELQLLVKKVAEVTVVIAVRV